MSGEDASRAEVALEVGLWAILLGYFGFRLVREHVELGRTLEAALDRLGDEARERASVDRALRSIANLPETEEDGAGAP